MTIIFEPVVMALKIDCFIIRKINAETELKHTERHIQVWPKDLKVKEEGVGLSHSVGSSNSLEPHSKKKSKLFRVWFYKMRKT